MPETISSFHGPYRWLSNFWPTDIFVWDRLFVSAEHAYVYSKARDEDRDWVYANMPSIPGQVKRFGRTIPIREHFMSNKLRYMEEIIHAKFTDEKLRCWLLRTGDAQLIEGNTWGDRFWGQCRSTGNNHLGKILMAEREAIRSLLQ